MKRTITLVLTAAFFAMTSVAGADDTVRRVVSLAPAITEIIYSLGAEDVLVGVSDYCDYPPAAFTKEKVGGFINPNLEKIVSLSPDMVILSPNSGTQQIQSRLDRLGVKNTVVSFYTIEELIDAYKVIGKMLGKEQEAIAFENTVRGRMKSISSRVQEAASPLVLFVRSHEPLYVAGCGTYEDDLITVAGGKQCIVESAVRYPQYNIEEIIRLNPAIIIDATFYETPDFLQRRLIRDFWSSVKSIDAVANGQVYIIKTDIHSVPGPRTPLMLDIMAQIVHPEIFGEETTYSERIITE